MQALYRAMVSLLWCSLLAFRGSYAQAPTFTPFTERPEVINVQMLRTEVASSYRQIALPRPNGSVKVWMYLSETGEVLRTQLKTSSNSKLLDPVALYHAERLRFKPAGLRGTPTRVWVDMPFQFDDELLKILSVPQPAVRDIVLRGGNLIDAVRDGAVANPGILIHAGKIAQIGEPIDTANADVVTLGNDEYVLPGFFDLHAHYAIDFFGGGRIDDTTVYPTLFLANGVTSTFPAGEMQPEKMRGLRIRIDNGQEPGPRIYNSGPYFGTARPGWTQTITADSIYREVDYWAEQGARGFKAKGIRPEHLQALIERAHQHGLTVTGHLDSGIRNSVNPRDAILMGIDRIEHFVGGDILPADKSAYATLENIESFKTPQFEAIVKLYRARHVNYDATRSAYGYYGRRDPQVYDDYAHELQYLTPYMRQIVTTRAPRQVNEQFEKIYWVKQKEIEAFYFAGGGDLITVGTDHPSWGEFFSGFSYHRELQALSLCKIPNIAVLKMATINGARALGVGDKLGTVEAGKFADLVVIRGNPLADIRNTRNVLRVIKAGVSYDPAVLLQSVVGRLGPANDLEAAAWGKR